MHAAEELDELILRAVGVLVLVDEDVVEPALPALELRLALLQQANGKHEEIVEVHGIRRPQRHLEVAVYQGDCLGKGIAGEATVLLGRDQGVLRVADGTANRPRCVLLRGNAMPLHEPLDHGELLVLVVDGERRRPMQLVRGATHNASTDRVKGAHPHPRGLLPELPRDALAHLASGLVGEGDGEDAGGVDSMFADEPRDARGQNARLAGARAGEHQQGPLAIRHRLTLSRIQAGQLRVIHRMRSVPR